MTAGTLPWHLVQQEIEAAIRNGFPGKKHIRSAVLADYLMQHGYSYFANISHQNAMRRVTNSMLYAGWDRWNPSRGNHAPVWTIPDGIAA